MKSSTFYRHYHLGIPGTPSVTLRVTNTVDSQFINYAICSPEDNFSRQKGREICDATEDRFIQLFKNLDYYNEPMITRVVNYLEVLETYETLTRTQTILLETLRYYYISEPDVASVENKDRKSQGSYWKFLEKLFSIPLVQKFFTG